MHYPSPILRFLATALTLVGIACAASASAVPIFVTIPAPHLSARATGSPLGAQVGLTWTPAVQATAYIVYRDGVPILRSPLLSATDYNVLSGETHVYRVAASGPRGLGLPGLPTMVRVPAGVPDVIYADGLNNGWQCWGWANLDLNNAAPVRAGRSLRVTASAWQALYLHHADVDTRRWAALTFWIHGGSAGGQKLSVRALWAGTPQAPVVISPPAAGQWRQVTIPLAALGVARVSDFGGLWIGDASGQNQPLFYLDEIALTPAPALPAVPGGLTATPGWKSGPDCPDMTMPQIALAWNAVPGASAYDVYRNGAKFQSGIVGTHWTDGDVTCGQTYSYTVSAENDGGEGAQSARVTIAAPTPPVSTAILTAPANLTVTGLWRGAASDVLSWSPVPGAASYTIYQYDTVLAAGLTTPSYTLTPGEYLPGETYTVTAVDARGAESLPSAPVTAQGAQNPAQSPSWLPGAPDLPNALSARAEWNAGRPRIALSWRGHSSDWTYTVYRDGQRIAWGVWGLNYFDTGVLPGERHSYAVSGVNVPWMTDQESVAFGPVIMSAPAGPPALADAPVQITDVRVDDDSAVVSFSPVPNAVDYRVFDVSKPNAVKYSGGGLSIEMNGLDPAHGADLVVEAVDKLGPFQRMDGSLGPGAMQMDGMHTSTNGQGDPSNVPNVLAASVPVHVDLQPMALGGAQVFFDTFRNEAPLTAHPLPAAQGGEFYGRPGEYAESGNDKWTVREYGADLLNTRVFFMSNHFMDTLYDGGTPGFSDPMHNSNASLVMMPNATADISGGRVLHVTFEVDAHMNSRRWCDVQIAAAGDLLTRPGKVTPGDRPLQPATTSGESLRWEIKGDLHQLMVYHNTGTPAVPVMQEEDLLNVDWATGAADRFGPAARMRWDGVPLANGTTQDLDKRHTFDLYLSQTHCRILENGVVIKDTDMQTPLPFTRCQVYWVHQLYHTANDRAELLDYSPQDTYWINNRPWSDERHWDNMGFSVLNAFPALL